MSDRGSWLLFKTKTAGSDPMDGTFVRRLGVLFVVILFATMFVPVLRAQQIDQAELKQVFFEKLSESQRVTLMRTIDRSAQRTSVELGAKYRWGYVPPDRTPPVELGRWWDGLNPRERRKERLEWFKNHYQQLNAQRAARELGLRDRLSKLYRRLEQDDTQTGIKLEKVSFPKKNLNIDTAQEQGLPEGYRRFKYDDTDQSMPTESSRETTTPRDESPEPEPDQASESEGARPDEKEEAAGTETVRTTGADTKSRGDTSTWERKMRYNGGVVIFQRVGDRITTTRRKTGYDTHLRTRPDQRVPTSSGKGSERPEPPLRFEEHISPKLRFYEPTAESRHGPPPR